MFFIPYSYSALSDKKSESDSDKEVNFYNTPLSRLYIAQSLLDRPQDIRVAYNMLRKIIKYDKDRLDWVVVKKLKQATKTIRGYLWALKFSDVLNQRFLERPYLYAKFLIAEAIMDYRFSINYFTDSESRFIDKLLKNYFFPGEGDKVTIHYPKLVTYLFAKYALTKENIKKAEVDIYNKDDSFWSEVIKARQSQRVPPRPPLPQQPLPTIGPGPKPAFPGTKPIPNSVEIPHASILSQNMIPISDNVTDLDPDQSLKEEEDLIIKEMAELGIDAYNNIQLLYQFMQELNGLRNRVTHEYLNKAMLMQAIIEPSSLLYDKQLEAFMKGVKIEYKVGEIKMPTDEEIEVLKDVAGEDVVDISEGSISINMTKLMGKKRDGQRADVLLKYISDEDNSEIGTLLVISSALGDDLILNKYLQMMGSVHSIAGKSAIFGYTKVGQGLNKIMDVMVAFGKGVDKSKRGSQIAKKLIWSRQIPEIGRGFPISAPVFIPPKGGVGIPTIPTVPSPQVPNPSNVDILVGKVIKSPSSLKDGAVYLISRADAPRKLHNKVVNSESVKKLMEYLKSLNPSSDVIAAEIDSGLTLSKTVKTGRFMVKHYKNGNFLKAVVALSVIMEGSVMIAGLMSDNYSDDEKLTIRVDGVSEIYGSLLYLYPDPYVRVTVAVLDVFHYFVWDGVPRASDFFRGIGRIYSEWGVQSVGFKNIAELYLTEYESKFNIPRSDFYISSNNRNIDSKEKAEANILKIKDEVTNITLSYMAILYKTYYELKDKHWGGLGYRNTIGEHIASYHNDYIDKIKLAKETKSKILGKVDLLKNEE